MSDQVKADELAKRYRLLRTFKAKVQEELDEKIGKVKAAMDAIENEMMTFLNQTGQDSAKTADGTFCKKTTTSAKVADRDVFLHFVMEQEATNFLTDHVSSTAVNEYIAEHKVLPPGIDVVKKVSISVTAPKTR